MSPGAPPPRPQPPRRDEPEHPAERGLSPNQPRGKQPAGKPAEPKNKGPVERAGKFFEVRRGRAGKDGEDESDAEPPLEVALPRSITQEQAEADLKRRLGREELLDIDKRHGAVKLVGAASAPTPMRRRSSGVIFLVLIVVAAAALFLADKYHLINLSKQPSPQATK